MGIVKLRSPLVVASGPGGMGEYMPFINPFHIGAYILKTITLHPKEGSTPPRLYSTDQFVINRIGLENPGIDRFVEDVKKGVYNELFEKVPVILSIGGDTHSEYLEATQRALSILPRFSGVEYNFSCPNVESGGLSMVADSEALRGVMKEIRKMVKDTPIFAKFGIEGIFVEEASDMVADMGWDGITLINTIRGLVKTPEGKIIRGGISGSVLKPISLRAVYEVRRRHPSLFIMASGGVYTGDDVRLFLEMGADAVQIGSALFKDPAIIESIYREIKGE